MTMPGTRLLGVDDHGGTDVVLAHELGRLAQRAPRGQREHVLRHRVVDLHRRLLSLHVGDSLIRHRAQMQQTARASHMTARRRAPHRDAARARSGVRARGRCPDRRPRARTRRGRRRLGPRHRRRHDAALDGRDRRRARRAALPRRRPPLAGAGAPARRGVDRGARRSCATGPLRGVQVVTGGRSSGARVACRTAEATGAAGVLCLAFPLVPPRRRTATEPPPSRIGELEAVERARARDPGRERPFGMPPAAPGRTVVQVAGTHSLAAGARRDRGRRAGLARGAVQLLTVTPPASSSSATVQSFTRGRPCGSPAARSAWSIVSQCGVRDVVAAALGQQRLDRLALGLGAVRASCRPRRPPAAP